MAILAVIVCLLVLATAIAGFVEAWDDVADYDGWGE